VVLCLMALIGGAGAAAPETLRGGGPPEAFRGGAPPEAFRGGAPPEASPTRSWHEVVLGGTDGPAAQAWAAARDLDCVEKPSPRRTTVHLACERPAPAAIGEGERAGRLERILVARLDDGPVHHVSTERSFESPAQAAATYDEARKALVARLGAPERTAEAPSSFDVALVHATTRWRFADLQVDLTVSRFGEGPIRLSERWDLPGAEDRAATRPGSAAAHGAPPAAARNPHLAD
jgi:hypothetical protein